MAQPLTPAEAFKLAVSRVENQTAAAALINRTQSRVSKLLAAEKPCPPDGVIALEAATGVSRHDLRPDIYPREEAKAQQAASLDQFGAAR